MNEQVSGTSAQSSATERKPGRKEPGLPLLKEDYIPASTVKIIEGKLPEGGKVGVAREDGAYKGKIVYSDDRYIGQAVGKDQKNAVLHLRRDVELVGSNLDYRAKNNILNGASVQVHYNGDKAKAYPFNAEREAKQREESRDVRRADHAAHRDGGVKIQDPREKKLSPDQLMRQAQQYASDQIKNPKQREAFLKHLEAATNREQQTQKAVKELMGNAGKKEDKVKSKPDRQVER